MKTNWKPLLCSRLECEYYSKDWLKIKYKKIVTCLFSLFCSFPNSIINTILCRGLKLSFICGPHFNKKGLAGRIKRKNVSEGCNKRLKVPLCYKNSSFSNNLSNFNDVTGRTNTSGGPHAARGPRVWDPWYSAYVSHDIYTQNRLLRCKPTNWNEIWHFLCWKNLHSINRLPLFYA